MTDLGTDRARILVGDALERLQDLPEDSIHTTVTSPPYWGLRDYDAEEQLGLEDDPEEYVRAVVEVFQEVRRVLHPSGTLWLNLGDSYAGSWAGQSGGSDLRQKPDEFTPERNVARNPPDGLKRKDLMFMPERVAMALQADGWWVRNRITWHKTNPKPSSIEDRFTVCTEPIFLLSARDTYFFDPVPLREPSRSSKDSGNTQRVESRQPGSDHRQAGSVPWDACPTRHPRDVWKMPTDSFDGGHFATFPPELPRRCIQAGTSEHGACPSCGEPWREDPRCSCGDLEPEPCTVLDPFLGAGTTALAALEEGRDAVGVELNPEYAHMAWERVRDLAEMPRLDEVPR